MRSILAPLFSLYHWLWALAAAVCYRFPSRRLFVIGVTGTKGKSTTAELIAAMLRAAGRKTAFLTSVWTAVGEKRERNVLGNSMPGRGAIQAFLRRAVQAGCTHTVIEVTSQGVLQHRHRFIDWDAAVFLNLAPEHIEAHGSFEQYRAAKVTFFASLSRSEKRERFFFVNAIDPNHPYFVEAAEGIPGAHIVKFKETPAIENPWFAPDFNRENAAAAAAVAGALGISINIIASALESFQGVPGRLDYVQEKPFAVVVDYAHTPDSLEKVYAFLAPRGGKGKLICVLGSAGGGRDTWKRPVMGKIAAQYCQKIILTNEDPYDEDPSQILDEIEKGISINQQVIISIDQRLVNQHKSASNNQHKSAAVDKIIDRQEAIKRAISLAEEGDAVIITGKGSECWIHLANNKKIPWDERKIIEETLRKS